MAIVCGTGTITVPAASTSAITIAHGLGTTPQLVVVFANGGTTTGQANGNMRTMIGVTDGTRHFSVNAINADAATSFSSTAAHLWNTNADLGVELSLTAVTGRYGFTSWDGTNFVITPSDALVAQHLVTWVAIAGLDGVYVDGFTLPTATGSFSRTGIPFQPDSALVLGASAGTASSDFLNTSRGAFCLGAADAPAQWCVNWHGEENASNYTTGGVATDRVLRMSNNGTTWDDAQVAFSGFDASGGTFDRTHGTAARGVCVVWLKGGLPVVGTFAARTTPGTISVPTSGHHSRALLLACRPPSTAVDTAPQEPGEFMLGVASSATDRRTMFRINHNAEPIGGGSPTDVIGNHTNDKIYRRFSRSGTDTIAEAAVADIQSVAQDAVTLDQTVADVATLVAYLSLGDPPAAAAGANWPDRRRRGAVAAQAMGLIGGRR